MRMRATVLALLSLVLIVAQPAMGSRDEYEVKAAFLLNFARLVEWPRNSAPAPGTPLVIAIVGENSGSKTVSKRLETTRVDGLTVEVRAIEEPSDLTGCHIVFFARGADRGDMLDAAEGRSILTVGESDDFARNGGIINFFSEGKKLRFQINPQEAKAAGLKISSRLLRLARLVEEN